MHSNREVITLQFGNFANYVGTHFWNMQEHSFNYDPNADPSDVNHDVLFREGRTDKKEVTYTPRMLLVDLKGTLRHVPQEGTLYTNPFEAAQTSNPDENFFEEFKETLAWDPKKVEVVKEVPVKKPEFQMDLESGASNMEEKDYKLKDSIENWPDFMYTRYHPRSVNLIRSYNYCEDYCSFDTFSIGQKLWSSEYFEDDFCDKIRVYIEECDFCQGFQTLFDAFDGFSGLTMRCFEYLHDEYSKTVFAMPVMSPSVKVFQNADENMSDSIRTVNTFLTYAHLPEHCDLFVPLSTMSRTWRNLGNPRTFPQFEYDVNNVYHSSAILASFLDTISLRYRLRNSSSSSVLSGFCSDLNGNGRKMASARLGLTLPMNEKEDFIDFLDRFEGELMQPLSPGSAVGTDRIIQAVAIRGIPKDRLKRRLQNAKHQMQMAAYKCSSVSEMMQLYFQCNNYASLSHVAAVETGMSIRAPYPLEFFDSRFTSNGFIKEFSSEVKQVISHVPAMAAIQNSNELSNTLDSLHQQVARIKIEKIPRFLDAGLDIDEYKESIEKLLVFKEQYEESYYL